MQANFRIICFQKIKQSWNEATVAISLKKECINCIDINVNASQNKNKLFFDFYQDFMIEVYVIGKLLKIYYLFT